MGQNVAAKNCPRTLLGCNIQSRLGQNCPRTNSVYSPKIVLGERVYINIHFTIAKSKQQHLNGYYINMLGLCICMESSAAKMVALERVEVALCHPGMY